MLAQGWDTIQESLNLEIPDDWAEELEAEQEAAKRLTGPGDPQGVSTMLGDEYLQAQPHGAKGAKWKMDGDDFQIIIRPPGLPWPVTVRYLSAGLWEHGIEELRRRAYTALCTRCKVVGKNWVRITRADWAFDFHSPAFTETMRPEILYQIVAHSSVKTRLDLPIGYTVARAEKIETLTIGSKSGLQIQVYDKGLEITEVSGKDWMIDLWRKVGQEIGRRPKDVWRLEVRMGRAYLADRNMREPEAFHANFPELVTEALLTRRLVEPVAGDSNKWRWPVHPLWSAAIHQFDAVGMVPIGRKVTGKRRALERLLIGQVAGVGRSAVVLGCGGFTAERLHAFFERAERWAFADAQSARKVEKAVERYELVEEGA